MSSSGNASLWCSIMIRSRYLTCLYKAHQAREVVPMFFVYEAYDSSGVLRKPVLVRWPKSWIGENEWSKYLWSTSMIMRFLRESSYISFQISGRLQYRVNPMHSFLIWKIGLNFAWLHAGVACNKIYLRSCKGLKDSNDTFHIKEPYPKTT